MDNEVKQYINLISDLLNIKVNNEITYLDITNSILKISNPVEFLEYVRKNFTREKYQFQTGYQKFNAMLNDFSSNKSYQIPYELKASISTYTDKLFSRLTSILDEIIYLKECDANKEINVVDTLKLNLDVKQYEVIAEIGKEKELLHLARYGREELRNRIINIVHLKAMLKHYGNPVIEKPKKNKPEHQDKNVIKKLKSKTNNVVTTTITGESLRGVER